jgi:hypothetical protein
MANELYKNHLIVSPAILDLTSHRWTTYPYVSWGHGANRKVSPGNRIAYRFDTRQDAEEFGIQVAKACIDNWSKRALKPSASRVQT